LEEVKENLEVEVNESNEELKEAIKMSLEDTTTPLTEQEIKLAFHEALEERTQNEQNDENESTKIILTNEEIKIAFHGALNERTQIEKEKIPIPQKDANKKLILNENIKIIDDENMEYVKRKRKKNNEISSIKKKKRNKARRKSEQKIQVKSQDENDKFKWKMTNNIETKR
jgi:hypothetical protein